MIKYRYPGPSPFTSAYETVFFGRKNDSEALYNSILLNGCTILVGKTGVGKSSLVNVEIIPRFKSKQETNSDKRQFIVLKLGIGAKTPNEDITKGLNLKNKVFIKIKEELGVLENSSFLQNLDREFQDSIFFTLKKYQYASFIENKNIVFLIIIDQLEELFTYSGSELKDLLFEIKEILSPNLPDKLRLSIENYEIDAKEWITDQEMEVLDIALNIKFLFSVRSDKLGLLIRLKQAIPNIFSSPFELRPLSKEQAYEAIKLPAEQLGDFSTPPFKISDETVEKIIDYLWTLPNSDLESNFEDLKIDPISLQIVCQHLEQNISLFDADKIIEPHEIGNFDEIFSNYYLEILNKINVQDEELLSVRILIEEKLIYEPDKRRRQLFYEECEVDLILLNKLVHHRLLREINTNGGKSYFEVAHDWLILPILNAKKKRLDDELKKHEDRVRSSILSNDNLTIELNSSFSDLKRKGDSLYADKNWLQAIQFYSAALDRNKRDLSDNSTIEIFSKRGECFLKERDFERASKDFKAVLLKWPEDPNTLFNLAYALQMLGKLEMASSNYEKAILFDANNSSAYYNLGIVYKDLANYDGARKMFLKVADFTSDDWEVWYNAGVMSNNLQDYEQSIQYLIKALELKVFSPNVYSELAVAYEKIGDYDKALLTYQSLTKYDPDSPQSYLKIHKLLSSLGRNSEAEKYFEIAEIINNNNPSILIELADKLFLKGKFESALLYFDRILKIDPYNLYSLTRKAEIFEKIGRINEAIETYKIVLSIDPKNEEIAIKLAFIFKRIGKFLESNNYFRQALANNGDNAVILFELGKISKLLNQNLDAEIFLLKALEIEPTLVDAKIELGYIFKTKGSSDLARKSFEEALASPNRSVMLDSEVLLELGCLEMEAKNNKKAYEYFSKIKENGSDPRVISLSEEYMKKIIKHFGNDFSITQLDEGADKVRKELEDTIRAIKNEGRF